MSIEKQISQYKDPEQLKEFAVAQQSTILQLSKKIQKLEEERDHLKKLLESSVPIIKDPNKPDLGQKFLTSSEETICVVQLEKLRDISMERELTLEEARRVEIFSKVLSFAKNAPRTIELKTKELSTEKLTEKLLALVDKKPEEKS